MMTTNPGPESEVIEAVRDYFRADRSRMTMMAARKFGIPEREIVDALVGQWPIIPLKVEAFRELVEAFPELGLMRVFVRSKAAVIESVGVFGGFSETEPFFNVQTDTLDMHILHAEIGSIYAVRKIGHDSTFETHSFQFFDHSGDAAFKAFLWENFPNVPPERVEAFQALAARFAVEGEGSPK
jgi:putative hemin transport protein